MHVLTKLRGLAVRTETRGFRLSGHMHCGGYDYGPAVYGFQGSREDQRNEEMPSSVPLGEVWR
jgi:hypothetical protein